jgi:plasmid stabilization system protein ParE
MPKIERAEEFGADASRQITYLLGRRELSWIKTLRDDLAELELLLAEFPLAGRQLAQQRTDLLLRLRLRTAPFYVWYSFDPGKKGARLRLLRLFHVRQQGPTGRLP